MDEDEIVISGISCRFPESDNMTEFAEHLFHGDDLVTEDERRWELGKQEKYNTNTSKVHVGLYGLPRRHAKLKDLSKFDAYFFWCSS